MKINRLILPAFLALAAISATAQNGISSPYSRYGFGILSDNVTSAQRGMGGVGYAMNSGRQINVMNPASYAAIDTLTFLFDIGGNVRQMWSNEQLSDGTALNGKNFGGGLDYITMQFPLGKYMGGSAGLLPYSQVGYSFGEKINGGASSHEGSGGINQVYVGVAGRPFKGFTVGANIAYLFGTTLNDTYATTTGGAQALFERVFKVSDYKLDIGVQYSHRLSPRHRLTAGVVYSPAKSFHGHTYGVDYLITNGTDESPDTTGYTSLAGKYSMAETWGAGLSYEWSDKLQAEIDFTYQPWSQAKYAPLEGYEREGSFADRWKFNAGLQFTPRPRGSYLQRINYRLGGFYTRDYLTVHGNNVKEYGVSIGFGLPTAVSFDLRSVINISIEYKRRQAYPAALIKEDYLMFTLGVNFNEMWFFQNKIR